MTTNTNSSPSKKPPRTSRPRKIHGVLQNTHNKSATQMTSHLKKTIDGNKSSLQKLMEEGYKKETSSQIENVQDQSTQISQRKRPVSRTSRPSRVRKTGSRASQNIQQYSENVQQTPSPSQAPNYQPPRQISQPPRQSQVNQIPGNNPNRNIQNERRQDYTSKLRGMNTGQLRQEVIQNQIQIERALIENQKKYRRGINTIRDLISPSAIKIESGKLEVGTKKTRTLFVLTYPRMINSGWLEGVVNLDVPLDLSIFIYPRESGDVLKELKKKVGKIQASLSMNMQDGKARDPALETAYQDVEGLRDAIQQGVENFFRVGIYVTIYADSDEQLERYSKNVESMLSTQNIVLKRAALQMNDGFNSTLPILKDDLDVFNNLNTSPLSTAFPFVSSDLSSNSGILYGINRHNTSLIIFDRFELENANAVVFATSGAGKSYAVKLEILRSLMMGISVIVVDPEKEYKELSDTVGGTYINLSLNSKSRINPFDLPAPLPGESRADILRTAIIDVIGLIRLMVGKVDPGEVSTLERAVKETYEKRDITAEVEFENLKMPTMGDLVDVLNGIVGGESLAKKLYRYTEGTFSGLFNQRTNINIDNNFIVFNIRDLNDELRPVAMYVLLKFVWNEIRSELKQRILVVDEAWIMMQYDDSAKFLYGLAKRARKYYLGVTTITQDVGDFLDSKYGRPIVTNAAMKILLKQSTAAIDRIADIFSLTGGEKQVLLQSTVGQGIFFAGSRHVAIEIVAFPTEHKIITTSPKEGFGK